jgi:uncharacterized LabA/DUF88 family protein
MKKVSIYIDMYNFLNYSFKYLKQRAYLDFVNFYKYFLKEDEKIEKVYIYGGSALGGLLYKLSHYDHIEITEEEIGWDKKEKRTDVNLAIDMLVGAFYNKYDKAILISGDSDFIKVVQEVKKLGKEVYIVIPENEGVKNARKLINNADGYYALDKEFYKKYWLKGKIFKC